MASTGKTTPTTRALSFSETADELVCRGVSRQWARAQLSKAGQGGTVRGKGYLVQALRADRYLLTTWPADPGQESAVRAARGFLQAQEQGIGALTEYLSMAAPGADAVQHMAVYAAATDQAGRIIGQLLAVIEELAS